MPALIQSLLLILPVHLSAETYKYQFEWMFLPVAELSIQSNQSFQSGGKINFDMRTDGPLKLYRQYSTNGYIENINDKNWNYYLVGNDRGVPEEKLISFGVNEYPNIKIFRDDQKASPIEIDTQKDRGAFDPFSVFLNTIKRLQMGKSCDYEYKVLDGKRRYKVSVVSHEKYDLDNSTSRYKAIKCRFTVPKTIESEANVKRKSWPFDGNEKYIDIWFSNEQSFMPEKYVINTPIGKIIGKIEHHQN